ncbi:Y-family DNA polymerase [Rubrolithibacter danxiaensis]|uniref:Y-family DNA polymerase n=1 Tax=Rubrolithibacter danxiaensis TaxID=3390805 RepID=UPI003BF81BCD
MYALIDCNNFYVSCERVFQPYLQAKAGCVLSNNDGCAIARSEEAKALGVKMATPYFTIRDLHTQGKIWWRSSNYALYQDMMRRVKGIIKEFFPEQEIYSIDECFCDLSEYKLQDLETLGQKLRQKIKQYTGIPVCVGIGATKTLAKLANKIAKKQSGVHILNTAYKIETALKKTEIGDVWGIGPKYAVKLIKIGVNTAFHFINLPADYVQTNMTIVGLRTWRELRGESCIDIELNPPDKKGISTARSFGKNETELAPMEEALATYVANAAVKLRNQNSLCANVFVFAHTSRFAVRNKIFSAGIDVRLATPTNITSELIEHAIYGLRKIYKKGPEYQKVGVYLTDLRPDTQVQTALFDDKGEAKRQRLAKATKAIDKLNLSMGRNAIQFGAMGFDQKWKMKQEYLSKRYTTRIEDVMIVKAC